MAARFVNIDRDAPLLLPPDLREWAPANHRVHCILEAVEPLDRRQVSVNTRGTGEARHPPALLLGLLIYSCATGLFGSRRIEQSTRDSVPVRRLTADPHPDHDALGTFRRENQALFAESFVKVLQLAQELKLAQFGQISVSVDGAKLAANAGKRSAASYERAGESIRRLELEAQQLLVKAEQADATPRPEGRTIPEELVRRQERKAALERARAHARYAAERADYEKKRAERPARPDRGAKSRGPVPQPPSSEPKPADPRNCTDPDSRIRKTADGFQQAYNAPAAVDSGFFSEAAVQAIEQTPEGAPRGALVYAALEKTGHHRNIADWEQHPEPGPPAPDSSPSQRMRHRLKTSAGKSLSKLRRQTVEPVFGIIKSAMGFRQFLLRGIEKVSAKWTLACLACNLPRLHALRRAARPAACG